MGGRGTFAAGNTIAYTYEVDTIQAIQTFFQGGSIKCAMEILENLLINCGTERS